MKKPCIECGALSEGSRCPEHARQAQRARDGIRGSAAQRGYDSAWRRVRLLVLERDGWNCHWCARPARTVDHIVPLAQGGARLDATNLAASCFKCNSSRGGRMNGGPRRRGA